MAIAAGINPADDSFRQELFAEIVNGVGHEGDRADGGVGLFEMLARDRNNGGSLRIAHLPYSVETGLPANRGGDIFWTDEMKVGDLRRIKYVGGLVVSREYTHLKQGVGLSTLRILRQPDITTSISLKDVRESVWLWKNH
jgi:hypothetical protein